MLLEENNLMFEKLLMSELNIYKIIRSYRKNKFTQILDRIQILIKEDNSYL